jgi:hypothetical protein
MTAKEAVAFERAVRGLVRPYAVDGVLDLPVAAGLTWGPDHRHSRKPVPTASGT